MRQKLALYMMLTALEIFLVTLEICGIHVKCSSITTPKKTISLTRLISLLQRHTLRPSNVCLFCLVRNMKLDFFIFIDNLLAANQSLSLASLLFAIENNLAGSEWLKNILVSSANESKSRAFETLHKSFI